MCLLKILRSGGFVWEASVDDVYELSAQVSFHVSVPWGIVPNDFSFAISVACWLWVVCELVVGIVSSKTFLLHEMLVSRLLMFSRMFFSSAGGDFLVYVEDFVVGFHEGFIRPTCVLYIFEFFRVQP